MTQDESAATSARSEDDGVDGRVADQPDVAPGRWIKRLVLALVIVALAYVLFRISAAFFPRWWAHRIADQVDGRLTAGTLWGLFYGFVFTFVPLLLVFQIRRRFFNWTWRLVVVVVAVVLATPNWLTLAVVAGNSKAAHAGERIFDVDAPGFRTATLIGACVAAALAIIVTGTSMVLAHRKRELKQLRGQLDEHKKARAEDVDHE